MKKFYRKKNLKDLREKIHGEDVKVDPVFISSSELRNITPPRIAKVIEESLPWINEAKNIVLKVSVKCLKAVFHSAKKSD